MRKMNEIIPIHVPKETVSDDEYLLVSLPVANGQWVDVECVIAVFETSKITFDLHSPTDGYLFYRHKINTSLIVGELFGVISSSEEMPEEFFENEAGKTDKYKSSRKPASTKEIEGTRFSREAEQLIDQHDIDRSVFTGRGLVRREDVEAFLSGEESDSKPTLKPAIHNDESESILIVGGGGLAKMVIDLIQQTGEYHIAGIVDSSLSQGDRVHCVEVIGKDTFETLQNLYSMGISNAVVAVGSIDDPSKRIEIYERLKQAGFRLPNLVHPNASVEPSVQMGEGNIILANATVGSATELGNLCYINTASVISHDCVLDDNVHLAPGAILAGRVTIGVNSLIGMGATVFIEVKIGRNVRIRNGLHTFKDIPDNTTLRK